MQLKHKAANLIIGQIIAKPSCTSHHSMLGFVLGCPFRAGYVEY